MAVLENALCVSRLLSFFNELFQVLGISLTARVLHGGANYRRSRHAEYKPAS